MLRFLSKGVSQTSLLIIILSFLQLSSFGQYNPRELVKWSFSQEKINDTTYNLVAHAKMQTGWHLFTPTPKGDGSQLPTRVEYKKSKDYKLVGKQSADGKVVDEYIDVLDMTIQYFVNSATYKQKVIVYNNTTIQGTVFYQTCNDDLCLPEEELPFTLKISGVPESNRTTDTTSASIAEEGQEDSSAAVNSLTQERDDNASVLQSEPKNEHTISATSDQAAGKSSLWSIFLAGIGAGFFAFLTPCIYAMLPITVSFFTKRSKTKALGIRNAVIYSISIIGIFALIGLAISLFFQENTMYQISTSIWFNLFVFAIFLVFGISLLGAFEITLPSSWSTKLDSKANTSSVGGIFFMALVLVVVSFSCTSAFISWLIVQIVQSQDRIGGVVGFLGFGLSIALPFALFAFFPSWLNNIAKSGGWLNSVKVGMGFIELAMAMKFLSNVDLQYHWGLLDYEVYLSIWIILFGLLGIYLLGKLKFSHDSELPKNSFGLPYLTVTRLFFAIASLSFTVYMIPGLFGAPLTGISGWLPERKTLEFNIHDNLISLKQGQIGVSSSNNTDIMPVKYTDKLKSELPGTISFFDYQEALDASKKTGKPVMLDFTGHSCVNCRKMERAVLSKPQILQDIAQNFILASLYCDDKIKLAEADQYVSERTGKKITTLGDKNIDIELSYGEVGQPMYIFVDGDGKVIANAGGYVPDVERFANILKQVKEKHKENLEKAK